MKNTLIHQGYSLVELLVVVTLFVIISVVAVSLFFTTLLGNDRTASGLAVKQNGDHAISLMSYMIRNSTRVTACSASSITILNRDDQSTTFSISSEQIASASATATSTLTGTDVRVNPSDDELVNPQFITCDPAAPDTKIVRIQFNLRKGNPTTDNARDIVTELFSTSVGL